MRSVRVSNLVKSESGNPTETLFGDGSYKVPSGGGGSGLTLISSKKITAPVPYFDVALPSGYDVFQFTFSNITLSTIDLLACAFSADAGATFVNDVSNADSYVMVGLGDTGDSLLLVSKPGDTVTSGQLVIRPGNADDLPLVMTSAVPQAKLANNTNPAFTSGWGSLNLVATTPPTVERYDLLRILPYGNGDCNPPTSGETITAGSWALFGTPTPS